MTDITPHIKKFPKILAHAIFYTSLQAIIGSIEMDSRFSIITGSKSQDILQNAADSLKNYLYFSVVWTFIVIFIMYDRYGYPGVAVALITNLLFIGWIYYRYKGTFKFAAKKYGLTEPTIF